jgi:hypothetical protein
MNNKITKLFNIKYPIIQGGMVWASGRKLVGAVGRTSVLSLILLIHFTSCFQSKESQESIEKTDEQVFYEIFPMIIDSFSYDHRIPFVEPHPPTPDYLAKMGYLKGENYHEAYLEWKKSDEFKDTLDVRKIMVDSIKNSITETIIILNDSINFIDTESAKALLNKYPDAELSSLKNEPFTIDSDYLSTNRSDFHIQTFTQLKLFGYSSREFWNKIDKSNVIGVIDISDFYIDDTRRYGVFEIGYSIAGKNGSGSRVFIRKNENDKWIIDEIDFIWVS